MPVLLATDADPRENEAGAAGFYVSKHFPALKLPRLQVLTVAELLSGKHAQYPRMNVATFKKAERQRKDGEAQKGLFTDADH